jgi:hypothetical protein
MIFSANQILGGYNMEVTTTLYYVDDFPRPGEEHRFSDEDLLGRALTQREYENITVQELRDAICHSPYLCCIDIEEGPGMRPTLKGWQEFIALSAEQLKERLRKNEALIIRSREPLFRNVFPPITKGPRKGYPNFKKYPVEHEDRLYLIEFLDAGTVAVENQRIGLADDGSFKILKAEFVG